MSLSTISLLQYIVPIHTQILQRLVGGSVNTVAAKAITVAVRAAGIPKHDAVSTVAHAVLTGALGIVQTTRGSGVLAATAGAGAHTFVGGAETAVSGTHASSVVAALHVIAIGGRNAFTQNSAITTRATTVSSMTGSGITGIAGISDVVAVGVIGNAGTVVSGTTTVRCVTSAEPVQNAIGSLAVTGTAPTVHTATVVIVTDLDILVSVPGGNGRGRNNITILNLVGEANVKERVSTGGTELGGMVHASTAVGGLVGLTPHIVAAVEHVHHVASICGLTGIHAVHVLEPQVHGAGGTVVAVVLFVAHSLVGLALVRRGRVARGVVRALLNVVASDVGHRVEIVVVAGVHTVSFNSSTSISQEVHNLGGSLHRASGVHATEHSRGTIDTGIVALALVRSNQHFFLRHRCAFTVNITGE